jgi:hypothetical protein
MLTRRQQIRQLPKGLRLLLVNGAQDLNLRVEIDNALDRSVRNHLVRMRQRLE